MLRKEPALALILGFVVLRLTALPILARLPRGYKAVHFVVASGAGASARLVLRTLRRLGWARLEDDEKKSGSLPR